MTTKTTIAEIKNMMPGNTRSQWSVTENIDPVLKKKRLLQRTRAAKMKELANDLSSYLGQDYTDDLWDIMQGTSLDMLDEVEAFIRTVKKVNAYRTKRNRGGW